MTNINTELLLENLLYKASSKLRATYAIEQITPIIQECLFLDLYSRDSKQFRKKLLSKKAYEAIKSDKVLNDILNNVFKILSNEENKLFNDIMKSFDSEDFNFILNNHKKSTVFKIAIEQMYKNNSFYYKTSDNINKLIARILENKEFKSLYDPTIGSGTLSLEVSKSHDKVTIYGQEIFEDALNTCKMLLILDDRIEDIENIHLGNTITNPMHIDGNKINKFDCIVADPPMSLKDWGYKEAQKDKFKRFERGIPPKTYGDYAFISHIVESLDENGIAVVLVSSGVLFRGVTEGAIRQKLIEENLVECVISLPSNMMHNTSIPVNLLILNKAKDTDKVLLIDVASNVASSRTLTALSDDMIERIGKVYEGKLEEDKFSKLVRVEAIKENDFNLSVNRYIIQIEEDEIIDISTVKGEIKKLEEKLKNIQIEINTYM